MGERGRVSERVEREERERERERERDPISQSVLRKKYSWVGNEKDEDDFQKFITFPTLLQENINITSMEVIYIP